MWIKRERNKNIAKSFHKLNLIILQVHERIGLSPGEFTKKHADRKDKQMAQKTARSRTYAAKKKRMLLKSERYAHAN